MSVAPGKANAVKPMNRDKVGKRRLRTVGLHMVVIAGAETYGFSGFSLRFLPIEDRKSVVVGRDRRTQAERVSRDRPRGRLTEELPSSA